MFIWPITKAVGDHYLLPGALTAHSARARTEKNRLGYATSKREMCRKDWTGRAEEREGQNTDRRYPSATLRSVGEIWMDPKRQTLSKRRLTNVLCLLPTILYSYFYVFCVESRDFADDCKFCRDWGSNWFLSVGFTSWLVDMQPVRSSVWEYHSAVRVCRFVWCVYYDGTPEEAALSKTSFKINICSPSCEESFDSDHRIRKANWRLKQM